LLDSAIALSGKDPQKDPTVQFHVKWTQALNLRAEGNYVASESVCLSLVHMAPELYWELFDLYLTGLKDRTKAADVLGTWYEAVGGTEGKWDDLCRLVDAYAVRLGDREDALQAIDDWVLEHPEDADRAQQLRENLKD
jgi:hypothetical protein